MAASDDPDVIAGRTLDSTRASPVPAGAAADPDVVAGRTLDKTAILPSSQRDMLPLWAGGTGKLIQQPPPASTLPTWSAFPAPAPGALGRVATAAESGWQESPPSVFTPQYEQTTVGNLLAPFGHAVGTALAAGNALFRGGQQFVTEALPIPGVGGGPTLGRELAAVPEAFPTGLEDPATRNLLAQSVPTAPVRGRAADVTQLPAYIAKRYPAEPEPQYVSGVSSPGPDIGKGSPQGPTSPSGIGTSAPPVSDVPWAGARTAAEGKQIASQYYKSAADQGGTLTPQFTNKFIDSVEKAMPQTEAGAVVGGPSAISQLTDRLQALRDQPMSLQAAQEVDEGLGNLIDKEYGTKGLSKEGKQLLDVQSNFRDMIANAQPGDVTGGTGGFDALVQGRKAWAQAMKMDDLERMNTRAQLTDYPATSFKTQIRTLLSSNRSRGYSDAERDAVQSAADRGVIGGALHVFGSRLVPLVAGGAGLARGPITAAVGAGLAHGATAVMRQAAAALQQNRLNRALGVLGSSVPPPINPLMPSGP